MAMQFVMVGAGFSGAVVARQLGEAGHSIRVFDSRDHVAGNCHTERDQTTGVMTHRYGPHLFHTSYPRVVGYLKRFTELIPNQHRVKATAASGVYSLPLNLLSMNQFFGTRVGPDAMRELIDTERDRTIDSPVDFEQQALSMMGPSLYYEFFRGYTIKQWGLDPTEIPASVLTRLPMRFDYNDRYFNDPYEYLPSDGYTAIVERILDHPAISVELGTRVEPHELPVADHVFWTGPLDAYFGYQAGRLGYRTLDFEWQTHTGSFQGCSVMNYCEPSVPHTRIAEHNWFTPWESHERSLIGIETSRQCTDGDIPYYPVRLARDRALLDQYLTMANQTRGITFLGRLGTYRYLDMDDSIHEALSCAKIALDHTRHGQPIPAFTHDYPDHQDQHHVSSDSQS